jgi:hypothetical protein
LAFSYFSNFWQAYPSGLAVKGDGIHVRLLPALPASAYTDADSNSDRISHSDSNSAACKRVGACNHKPF